MPNLLTIPATVLLTVGGACAAHHAQPSYGSRSCGGGDTQLFDDPVVPLVRDSVTAGGPAVVAQFYWTGLAAPVSSGFWTTDDRTVRAPLDSVGRTRVSVPTAGLVVLRTRVIGSITRVDSLIVPHDSTAWVRIGLARASLESVCVTVSESRPHPRSLANTERPA